MKIPFKIDENIPLPPRGHSSKYKFADMKAGDSFLGTRIAYDAANMFGRRQSPRWRFAFRIVEHGGANAYRIWRLE